MLIIYKTKLFKIYDKPAIKIVLLVKTIQHVKPAQHLLIETLLIFVFAMMGFIILATLIVQVITYYQ